MDSSCESSGLYASLRQKLQQALWLKRIILLLNVLAIAYVLSQAEVDGLGPQAVNEVTEFTAIAGNAVLLWRLVKKPDVASQYLSMQCVGILAVCRCLRAISPLKVVGYTTEVIEDPLWWLATPLLALLSLAVLNAAALGRRGRPAYVEEDDRAAAQAGTAFGSELLRSYLAPTKHRPPVVLVILEQLILPVAALFIGATLAQVAAGSFVGLGLHVYVSSWRQVLENVAMLPQVRVLLALRVGGDVTGSISVPEELTYWLTSAALGHALAFSTFLVDALSPKGAGRAALVGVCGEGLNAALLLELLLAHCTRKWRGEKKLVLPA